MSFNYKHLTAHKWFRFLLIFTFGLIALGSGTAFIVVDCRPQSGKPANQTLCNGIIAGAGNSSITVDKDQTVTGPFFGDGVLGNGGNDIIINNGTTVSSGGDTGRNGDIEGDVATGNGGDDVIVNNGTVASDMDGDTALGSGGNDVLINNGSVGDDMDGDNARVNGGDDLIINNGTVGGDIQADDNEDVANSHGGNDIVVINGTVEGSVDGDAGVKTGGDDVVILQNGANGGTDHRLYINGSGGNDTLVFNFAVPDQSTLDTLSAQIAAAKPSHDSMSFNGQTFEWINFEHLENQLVLKGTMGAAIIPANGKPQVVIDASGAAVYCTGGKLIAAGLDSSNRAEWLFTVKAVDLKASLTQASSSKVAVTIAQADGQSLMALPSDKLSLSDTRGRYTFTFAGDYCAG